MAERGCSLNNILGDLEIDRITAFVAEKSKTTQPLDRKGNGFEEAHSLLKEMGVLEGQIELKNDYYGKQLCYYCNGETNKEDFIYFRLLKNNQLFVLFQRKFSQRCNRYKFEDYRRSDLTDLLKEFPMKCVQWDEENKAIVRIFEKTDKMRKMAETSIKALVDNELKDQNYDYSLEVGKRRTVLVVQMKRQRKLEISLTNKGFQKVIGELTEIIDKIMSLSDDIKVGFKITHSKEKVKA